MAELPTYVEEKPPLVSFFERHPIPERTITEIVFREVSKSA